MGELTRAAQREFWHVVAGHGRAALVTVVRGPFVGAKVFVTPDREPTGRLGSAALTEAAIAAAEERMWRDRSELVALDDETQVFVHVTAPPPRLVIFGGSPVSAALCRVGAVCGWESVVIDPRSPDETPVPLKDGSRILNSSPARAIAALGGLDRSAYVVVLFDEVELDDAALRAALGTDAVYIGAMGSRRAHDQRRKRLLQSGLSPETVDRIYSPIGLDLGADSAPEIAVSIMAEIVAVRHGRLGGHLATGTLPIH